MIVKKGIEIKLYPNKAQKVFFAKTFGCCRFVYNQCLKIKSYIYEETKMSFQPKLKSFKEEWGWLREADSQGLANAYMDLSQAYQNFFNGKSKYPRYKSKKDKQSYRNAMCHKDLDKLIVGNTIVLPKVGAVKCRFGKTFEHENIVKIYNVTIKKSKKGDYYCSICCDVDVPEMEHTGECVGLDLGIKSSIVMSNGEVIKNPHFEAKSERKIRHLQRKLAKAKKGGSRYEKVRIQLAAAHEKLGNRRNNFLHQVSHRLIRDYDIICMENLNIKGMQKNHCLAGALANQALGTLTKMIEYKAQWHNRTVVKVGRFFPSSQICNNCGHRYHTLKLSEREWICPDCGSVIDRDWNAAKNILDEGLRILDNEGTPRTGEAMVLRPLCLAENPTVDDRLDDLKSSGAVMREIQLVAPVVKETHRSLASG
jgi:putative transposase